MVRAAVEAAAVRLGLSEDAAGKVVLAVDEAASNVIRHGYGGRQDRPIWMRISPIDFEGNPAMEILIEDECQGVDLNKIKGRPLEEIRPGGLGVHIIQGVMDAVEYRHREDGAGISLRMVKRIQSNNPVRKD